MWLLFRSFSFLKFFEWALEGRNLDSSHREKITPKIGIYDLFLFQSRSQEISSGAYKTANPSFSAGIPNHRFLKGDPVAALDLEFLEKHSFERKHVKKIQVSNAKSLEISLEMG